MGVGGRPNRTSPEKLMGADNQKIPNSSDLYKKQVYFSFTRSCKQECRTDTVFYRVRDPVSCCFLASLTVALITKVISRSSMAALTITSSFQPAGRF